MQQALTDRITAVEKCWIADLSKEVERLFAQTWLPSHDLTHHKRVWYFAKELLYAYNKLGCNFSESYLEALIIAVFFHDTGLTITSDAKHGYEGSLLAKEFLQKKPHPELNLKHELFHAIIKHDDKNYESGHTFENVPGIYLLLTIADDLDALGSLGLLRYLEIYWKRSVTIEKIVPAIKKNLFTRYNFLARHLLFDPVLTEKHRKRFATGNKILEVLQYEQLEFIFKTFYEKSSTVKVIQYTNRDKTLKLFFKEIESELELFEI